MTREQILEFLNTDPCVIWRPARGTSRGCAG